MLRKIFFKELCRIASHGIRFVPVGKQGAQGKLQGGGISGRNQESVDSVLNQLSRPAAGTIGRNYRQS